MRALFAILLLAACGGSSKSSSTTPKEPAVTCTTTAGAMVAMMSEGKNQESNLKETQDGFAAIIRTRCDEDKWTAEAQQCLSTMKTRSDAERCSTMLTEEQQANLVRDQKAKFGAGSPSPDEAPKPEANMAKESPVAPAGAPPPPPMKAEEGKMGKQDKADKKRSGPPAKGTKAGKTGDPCDGGE